MSEPVHMLIELIDNENSEVAFIHALDELTKGFKAKLSEDAMRRAIDWYAASVRADLDRREQGLR